MSNAEQPNHAAQTWPTIGWLLAILAVAVVTYELRPYHDDAGEHPAVGSPLLAVDLQPLTGADTAIDAAMLKGKVTLINFWGTWCPPCRQEFPHLVELAKDLSDQPEFQLLLVSCSSGYPELPTLASETRNFLQERKTSLPTYSDPQFQTRRAIAMAGGGDGIGYPTSVLLDRGGVIRAVWVGYQSGSETSMRHRIDELLK